MSCTQEQLSAPLSRMYVVTMPDGSVWKIPVWVIVAIRAQSYAEDPDNDMSFVVAMEDTLDLFQSESEIKDWARNNMNWDEVESFAVRAEFARDADLQEGWVNGEVEIN